MMGSGLPSAEEVLIIRPTGNKGSSSLCLSTGLRFPGAPARTRGIPKQDPSASGPSGVRCLSCCGRRSSRINFIQIAISRKVQGAILMKKILVTVVLGVAVLAGAQSAQPAQSQPAAPPAQAQPAAPQSTAPVIKDPAEYNAYVAATQ